MCWIRYDLMDGWSDVGSVRKNNDVVDISVSEAVALPLVLILTYVERSDALAFNRPCRPGA
jgi:hypothetical protein